MSTEVQNYPVRLQKDYVHNQTGETKTIAGVLMVEAASQREAEAVIGGMIAGMTGALQTSDPRIEWEEEVDLEEWTYDDFTFVVDSDEQEKVEAQAQSPLSAPDAGEVFVYEMRSRPPDFGTHPTAGLIGHEEGGDRYGFLKYNRQLTTEEAYNFELRPRPELSVKRATFEAKPGDGVCFVPFSPRGIVTQGILVEEIKGSSDARGWHILAPLPGDPGCVVRVWEEDGLLGPERIELKSPQDYLSTKKGVRTFDPYREVCRGSHYEPEGLATLSLANAKVGDVYRFRSEEWTVKNITSKTMIFVNASGKTLNFRDSTAPSRDRGGQEFVRRDIGGWLVMKLNSNPRFHDKPEAVKNLEADPMYQHAKAVEKALSAGLPVSAAAVDDYELVIPPGYQRGRQHYSFSQQSRQQAMDAAARLLPTVEADVPGESVIL